MTASPRLLTDLCIEYICDNIDDLVVKNGLECRFRSPWKDTYLHTLVAEKLFTGLCQRRRLSDLMITLFDAKHARLKRVKIPHAELLTRRGFRVLREHAIVDLEVAGLKVTVNDLVMSLGDRCLANLKNLSVVGCSFLEREDNRFCVVVGLSKLRSLRSLDVSNTDFNSSGLDIVCHDLPLLESLNIANTLVENTLPLAQCGGRLKSLFMYNLKISNLIVKNSLVHLKNLKVFDWSDSQEPNPFEMFQQKSSINPILDKLEELPHLISVDISGREGLDSAGIESFLNSHPNLEFIGMLHSEIANEPRFTNPKHPDFNPDLVVTGLANEEQLLESLRRYWYRPYYVQKILYYLFRMTPNFSSSPREDVLRLVIRAMRPHPQEFGVQMAATACLYNLTKGEFAAKLHPSLLKEVVELTLTAMERYPNYYQMQKNTLLTLCSDRILQDVPFDKYKCARLVLNCLCNFDDPSMNRMSVAICSILAAKICTKETHLLGAQPSVMRKLLEIVRGKVANETVDITIKFTLSALWNLTDESPTTCQVFLAEGGMDLFQNVLEVFEGKVTIETKVLGLLNNIAEVKELRPSLMNSRFVSRLKTLLLSREYLDVSYFAAGIIAHLASDGPGAWTITDPARDPFLRFLGDVVLRWEVPDDEMVAYRSFKPFFPLLAYKDSHQVQLWAAWAIHHVCAKNSKKYCPMLVQEEGVSIIRDLALDPETQTDVKTVCSNILTELDLPSC